MTEAEAAANHGRFVWAELMTSDPAGAAAFYTDVVGWSTRKWEGPGAGDYTTWMAGDKAVGGLMSLPQEAIDAGGKPTWFAYTAVQDVDATVADALDMGAATLLPPQSIEGVGRLSVLRDPQGLLFAVIRGEPSGPVPPETRPERLEFGWHELTTRDLDGEVAFYQRLFGWEMKRDVDMGEYGVYRVFGRGPFEYGGMMKLPSGVDMPPYWLHYITVRDTADLATERAQRAGATLVQGPMDVPGGDRVATLVDPQGALFAVHSRGES